MHDKILCGREKALRFFKDNRIFMVAVMAGILGLVIIGCQNQTGQLTALEITSPQNRAEITEDVVMVSGIVSPPSSVVSVNGHEVDVAEDGTFSRSVALEYGENTIDVRALTASGQELTNKTLTVVRNLGMTITSPEDKAEVSYSPIILRGSVSDTTAVVRVNNRSVEVADDGSFFTAIDLNYVKNIITVEATVAGQNPVTRTISVNRVLVLRLDSPAYQIKVTEGTAEVKGVVYPPSAVVTINGQEVGTQADGSFHAYVELDYGENVIVVNATDPVTRTIIVDRELTLDVNAPKDGDRFSGEVVTVSGTVSDPTVTVTVNEVPVEIEGDGTFTAGVPLDYGENPIVVTATTGGDNPVVQTETLAVQRVLTVNFNSPTNGSELSEPLVTLQGVVSDPVAVVTVDGQAVTVGENGAFSAEVALEAGENIIRVVAQIGEDVTVTETMILYYVLSD